MALSMSTSSMSLFDWCSNDCSEVSLLQWHSILNTSSFLPPIHIHNGTKCLHGWKYGLWPESAISREQWGMACEAWPGSAIVSAGVWHNCIGLGWNTKHLSGWLRVRGWSGGFYTPALILYALILFNS